MYNVPCRDSDYYGHSCPTLSLCSAGQCLNPLYIETSLLELEIMDGRSNSTNMTHKPSSTKPYDLPYDLTEEQGKKPNPREQTSVQGTGDKGSSSGSSAATTPEKPFRGRVQDRPSGG